MIPMIPIIPRPQIRSPNQTRMIDAFPGWLIGNGIFSNMVMPPWASNLTAQDMINLDVAYFGNHSGSKYASPIIIRLMGDKKYLSESDIETLEWAISTRYYPKWSHLWSLYQTEYSPLDTYSVVETGQEEIESSTSGSDNRTKNLQTTDTGSHNETKNLSTSDTGSHNETKDLTTSDSGSHNETKNLSTSDQGSHNETKNLSTTDQGSDNRTLNLVNTDAGEKVDTKNLTTEESIVATRQEDLSTITTNNLQDVDEKTTTNNESSHHDVYGFNTSENTPVPSTIDGIGATTAVRDQLNRTGTVTEVGDNTITDNNTKTTEETGTDTIETTNRHTETGTDNLSKSNTRTETGTDNTSISNTRTETGTDNTSITNTRTETGTDNTSITNTRTEIGTDNTSISNTRAETGTDNIVKTESGNRATSHTVTRTGRMYRAPGELLSFDRDFWLTDFFDIIFADLDSFLCLSIYDPDN